MPIGGSLDSLPTALFVAAHVVFLITSIWAIRRARSAGYAYAPALALYAIAQVVFLAVFGGALTLKMGVLIEQTLIFALIVWLVLPGGRASEAVR